MENRRKVVDNQGAKLVGGGNKAQENLVEKGTNSQTPLCQRSTGGGCLPKKVDHQSQVEKGRWEAKAMSRHRKTEELGGLKPRGGF